MEKSFPLIKINIKSKYGDDIVWKKVSLMNFLKFL